jgi:hypothetical protein
MKPKSKLFISGGLKQSGNGQVKPNRTYGEQPKPFDFDAPETRHVTIEELKQQPSMYEMG